MPIVIGQQINQHKNLPFTNKRDGLLPNYILFVFTRAQTTIRAEIVTKADFYDQRLIWTFSMDADFPTSISAKKEKDHPRRNAGQ